MKMVGRFGTEKTWRQTRRPRRCLYAEYSGNSCRIVTTNHETQNEIRAFAAPVESGLNELIQSLKQLHGQREDVQTYHAKKIANRLCDLYLSVVALKEAEENERKQIIARLFLQHIWGCDLFDAEMLSVRHFDLVMNETKEVEV